MELTHRPWRSPALWTGLACGALVAQLSVVAAVSAFEDKPASHTVEPPSNVEPELGGAPFVKRTAAAVVEPASLEPASLEPAPFRIALATAAVDASPDPGDAGTRARAQDELPAPPEAFAHPDDRNDAGPAASPSASISRTNPGGNPQGPKMSAGAGRFLTEAPPWSASAMTSDPDAGAGRFLTDAPPWAGSGWTSAPDAGAGPFETERNTAP